MKSIMDLEFDDLELYDCAEAWNKLDPTDRLSMSFIELAEFTEIKDTEAWKRFLKEPRINEYIDEEVKLFTQSQARKLITTATENDRSTGAAQMISALSKTLEETSNAKEGNVFIYSYVPLTSKEILAPNTSSEENNIFDT